MWRLHPAVRAKAMPRNLLTLEECLGILPSTGATTGQMETDQYDKAQDLLQRVPRRWLITGVAGFVGSNLLETLLKLNQRVVGLDNFLTGRRRNLEEVKTMVSPSQWERFVFIEGDMRDVETCRKACHQIDYVLHQAALGSVPRSVENPIATNEHNTPILPLK